MKPQDIVFILLLAALAYKRNAAWLVIAGVTLLVLSMPLFYFQIFFTAQRLVVYAAIFFLIGAVLQLIQQRKHDRIKK